MVGDGGKPVLREVSVVALRGVRGYFMAFVEVPTSYHPACVEAMADDVLALCTRLQLALGRSMGECVGRRPKALVQGHMRHHLV